MLRYIFHGSPAKGLTTCRWLSGPFKRAPPLARKGHSNLDLLKKPRKNKKYSPKGTLVRLKIKPHLKQTQAKPFHGFAFQTPRNKHNIPTKGRNTWPERTKHHRKVKKPTVFWGEGLSTWICLSSNKNDKQSQKAQ